MELKSLLKAIDVIQISGELPNEITAVQYHSGQVTQGDLFCCIKGYVTDGHHYLANAREGGASVAIVESFQPVEIPQILVGNSRLAMALIADAYYQHPSQKMKMIGITATNGKTSTSFMVQEILKASGHQTGIIGTVMTQYADVLVPSMLTTPESVDLHRYFSDMVSKGISHAVMEVSSSGQELNRVGGVDFDVVTFNNISHEHIDQHGSFEAYLEHKTKLIKAAKPSAVAVLNLDDPYSKDLINKTQAQVITYGVKDRSGHLEVLDLDLSTGRAQMTIKLTKALETRFAVIQPTTFKIQLGVAGYHSAMNALAAIGATLALGISVEAIQKGLSSYRGVERRFEALYEGDFKVYDDHFANGGNIDVTLETLTMMDFNKLVLVYAIRGSRGVTTNQENADMIVKWAKKLGLNQVIATLSEGHVGTKDIVTPEEQGVFLETMKAANIQVHLYRHLKDAVTSAVDTLTSEDVLLLAGCQGMDHGGRIALEYLATKTKSNTHSNLMGVIANRVCGMEPQPVEALDYEGPEVYYAF